MADIEVKPVFTVCLWPVMHRQTQTVNVTNTYLYWEHKCSLFVRMEINDSLVRNVTGLFCFDFYKYDNYLSNLQA